ncbi:hypothetical protein B0A49_04191 [Cryomyces minteri]|nr:hypothetical protein B0A49_05766 [Cryomyces minteri]TKA73557.1 hypothetical protein B0A49_04191 [Cryomyces minteri]
MAAARLAGMPASYQAGYQQQPHLHDSMQQTYGRQPPAYDTPPVVPPKDGMDIRTQRFTSPAIDPRQHNIEYQLPGVGPPQSAMPDPRAKRTSHFFGRNSLRNSNPAVLSTNDRINPHLVADDDGQRAFSISSSKPDSQAKRKSGLFRRAPSFGAESFLSRDSSNAGRPGSRTELKSQSGANPALPAATRAAESTADRPGTLKKLQRASTSSGQLDTGKKKRFSTFGSLFGRSGTTGHSAEKPKKLTKSEPPKIQQPRQTSPGPSRNQSAYEAMRSHYPTVPRPQHGPRSSEDDIPSPQGQQEVQGSGTQRQVWQQPPIGGYYAPPGWTAQSTPPPQAPTENRRKPSGGRPRYVDAPSNMAPVSIQYGSPYQSQNSYDIGPQRMASPRSPRRSGPDSIYPQQRPQQSQPSPYDVYAPLPPQLRHYSTNSVSTKISPQVSAQSPTQSPHHSSRGSVSPIDTFRHGSSSFRQQQPGPRMGSLGAQVARSPAQDHSGQQTPWAIALPTEDEDPRYIYSAQQQYSEPPPQGYQPRRPPYAPRVQPYRDPYQRDPSQYPLPMSPQSPTSPQYPSMPAMSSPPLPPKTPLDTRMYDIAHVEPSPYPSPPYSPSADQQYAPQVQSQYRSQSRYYQQERPNLGSPTSRAPTNPNSNNVNPNMFDAPSQPQTIASNHSHDTSWGTSHAGESDERIEMRGASYPGQEWAPSGLSHQSWD